MRKFTMILMIMLVLCSCQNKNQVDGLQSGSISESSTSSKVIIEEVVSDPPFVEGDKDILWGQPSDLLKKYEDHDGSKNQYEDYRMILAYQSEDVKKEVQLDESVGSQFLTELQNLGISKLQPLPPSKDTLVKLNITDRGIEYTYLFYPDGAVYTVQDDKWYYLGMDENKIKYDTMISQFIFYSLKAIPLERHPTIPIPPFDPFQDTTEFRNTEENLQNKVQYDADSFAVCIEWTDYGNRSAPIVIQNRTAKEGLFQAINEMEELKELELGMGTGPIIRIYKENVCYNYRIAGQTLLDYHNQIALSIPDNTLLRYCREISAYELA